jgi:hypothetical protein
MRFAGRVLVVLVTVALATYVLDCAGMTTPEQAMQCCNSMRCPSHGHHGQDCCKTVPATQVALGQPTSIQSIFFSPVALGPVQALADSPSIESSGRVIPEHSHDPPPWCPLPAPPLRI